MIYTQTKICNWKIQTNHPIQARTSDLILTRKKDPVP